MKTAEEILYQFCGDKQVNDGKSLYYLGGQENKILQAMKAYHAEQLEAGIKAKALRKKGTDEWYWEGIKPNWDLLGIPNCIQNDCTMNEVLNYYESVPTDAELVDITIIINK